MILRSTVVAAHQELGLRTDDETVDEAWEEIQEATAERTEQLHQVLTAEWRQANPEAGSEIPYLDNVRIGEQAQRRAQEEILEEWINEPVRDAISRREENAAESA